MLANSSFFSEGKLYCYLLHCQWYKTYLNFCLFLKSYLENYIMLWILLCSKKTYKLLSGHCCTHLPLLLVLLLLLLDECDEPEEPEEVEEEEEREVDELDDDEDDLPRLRFRFLFSLLSKKIKIKGIHRQKDNFLWDLNFYVNIVVFF